MNILERVPFIAATRRNHGIEHATVYVLSRRQPQRRLVAHSDHRGFLIFGDTTDSELTDAVNEALHRLQAGEARLAVHPNCGTNYATAGFLAGGAAWLAGRLSGPKQAWWEQLSWATTAATLALFVAQPLGLALQTHVTTSAQAAGIRLASVTRQPNLGPWTVHFVELTAA